jgi:hypothetical protein
MEQSNFGGSWLVVGYRKLNEKTVGNAYPLPDITEILDQLGQTKYFSCLDLAMGYHQIEMDPSDNNHNSHSSLGEVPFGYHGAVGRE